MDQPNSHANRDPRGTPYEPKRAYTGGSNSGKQPFKAKGHDIQLQDAQQNNLPVLVSFVDGSAAHGVIVRRDKFTITVKHSAKTYDADRAGFEEIFYKSSIRGILIERS